MTVQIQRRHYKIIMSDSMSDSVLSKKDGEKQTSTEDAADGMIGESRTTTIGQCLSHFNTTINRRSGVVDDSPMMGLNLNYGS